MAAAAYDAVLLVALWFAATAALLPVTGGEAVSPGAIWYQLYLAAWALVLIVPSWVRGGQTLGMRAWRIRLVDDRGRPPGWRRALIRFGVAIASWVPAGLGFWWSLLRRDRRTWHDLVSATHLERAGTGSGKSSTQVPPGCQGE